MVKDALWQNRLLVGIIGCLLLLQLYLLTHLNVNWDEFFYFKLKIESNLCYNVDK